MFATPNPTVGSPFERMRRAHPGWSDIRVIRTLCAEVLVDAEVEPPVNVELIASLRGISRIDRARLPWSGSISQEGQRLVVRVNAMDSHERQRFSILHEAIHTMLPGFDERVQLRCAPRGPRPRTEVLCDLGAAELLFPRDRFAADLAALGLSFASIEDLAAMYEASIESTAIRAIDLALGPGIFVVLAPAGAADDPLLPDDRLWVSYAHRSGYWPSVPAGTEVDSDSPFARAYEGEIIDETGNLSDLIPGVDRPVRVMARAYGRERRVFAIIRQLS